MVQIDICELWSSVFVAYWCILCRVIYCFPMYKLFFLCAHFTGISARSSWYGFVLGRRGHRMCGGHTCSAVSGRSRASGMSVEPSRQVLAQMWCWGLSGGYPATTVLTSRLPGTNLRKSRFSADGTQIWIDYALSRSIRRFACCPHICHDSCLVPSLWPWQASPFAVSGCQSRLSC